MNTPTLKLMPTDEEKLEKSIAAELHDLGTDLEVKKDSPDPSVTNRDLLQRSAASFQHHLQQLEARIADINQAIEQAREKKNAEIAKIEERYKLVLHDAEKDLYQIKTLKGAVELAIVALGTGE